VRGSITWLALAAACSGDPAPAGDPCADFDPPVRPDASRCDQATSALELATCLRGSGHAGQWTSDPDGLPAYDLTVEQRCDPAGQNWSPRSRPQRDPIHVIGNGRGLVAMAHASGGIELYSQDRGHKWLNRIDDWRDPEEPGFPVQLGGGFSYLVDGDQIHSTRHEDLPVASQRQTRRFGVGYVETVTTAGDLVITRRVLAPDAEARALVAEVTVENRGSGERSLGLVELWDLNLHQIAIELAVSDLLQPNLTEAIERRRRALATGFEHRIDWDGEAAVVETTAIAPPAGIDRMTPSDVDYFPEPVYLAALDGEPDAVWLVDQELWPDDADRAPPAALAGPGDAGPRTEVLAGAGQRGILALRVPLSVAAGERITRRFAFGTVPGGGSPEPALAELRAIAPTAAADAARTWRDRMVWLAVPGAELSGMMQREVAWASYSAQAIATRDEFHGRRLLGQGGAYKYIHGMDGAIGDYALFAQSMLHIDPELARDTLALSLATQHASDQDTPGRFPYATTGVGSFTDVIIYDQRSDAYFLLPSIVAEYVAASRDWGFLASEVPYWPNREAEPVAGHLRRIHDYAVDQLGLGARGFVAMGTGDYADGVLGLTDEPATPTGTSSLFNVGFVLDGFPLLAEVIERVDADLAAEIRALHDGQAALLEPEGWSGERYHRGFVDSGAPLAPDTLFLEPQVLPIIAGVDQHRAELLDLIERRLETGYGAMSNIGASGGGIDQPLVGGVWPVANAWLTEAYALADREKGWSSFVRNSLGAHADAFPDLWYGIWTGPDSFNGPGHERPGEADAHLATALTDYPALNAHVHTSVLRALVALLGVEPTAGGLRIAPRLPVETFEVVMPRLAISSAPDQLAGAFVPSGDDEMEIELALPSGLAGQAIAVEVDGAAVEAEVIAETVRFPITAVGGRRIAWTVRRAE
jgi:hypothetical protein